MTLNDLFIIRAFLIRVVAKGTDENLLVDMVNKIDRLIAENTGKSAA